MSVKYILQPLLCPICGEPLYEHGTDSITLVCENSKCSGKILNKLEHMYGKKGLDVKGISVATLEKFLDWGYISKPADLYCLSERVWKELGTRRNGFSAVSVNNLKSTIEKSRDVDLWRVIAAAGIPEIGGASAKILAKHFQSWDAFITAAESNYDFTQISGFGEIMSKNISSFDYTDIKEVVTFLRIKEIEKESKESDSLKGKTFAITGKLKIFKNRNALKEKIEAFGGRVVGSVTTKTDFLINNDNTSESAKNKKARELGIPIINEEKFLNLISNY